MNTGVSYIFGLAEKYSSRKGELTDLQFFALVGVLLSAVKVGHEAWTVYDDPSIAARKGILPTHKTARQVGRCNPLEFPCLIQLSELSLTLTSVPQWPAASF